MVYKAKLGSSVVAIKLFRLTAFSEAKDFENFEREIKLLSYDYFEFLSIDPFGITMCSTFLVHVWWNHVLA